jgi:hypothetical protein
LREAPEAEWDIARGTFVLYHLFPNIQLLCSKHSATLIRIYPEKGEAGRSISQISFYFTPELAAHARARDAEGFDRASVYDQARRETDPRPSLQASLEVFASTIEQEDYVMGAMQQRAAESGQLQSLLFGRNEPALHHFHQNYREALGEPPLVPESN